MRPIIACFLLFLVFASVAHAGRKDWTECALPGCGDYFKELFATAKGERNFLSSKSPVLGTSYSIFFKVYKNYLGIQYFMKILT